LLVLLALDYAATAGAFPELPALPYVTPFFRGLPIHLLKGPAGASVVCLAVFAVLTIAVVFWAFARYLEWTSDVYAVTYDRLVEQKGVILHEIREIPLSQIRSVDVDQGTLAARILKYGSLRINSLQTAQSGGRMSLEPRLHILNPRSPEAKAAGVELWVGIPDPLGVQQKIERQHLRFGPPITKGTPPRS
jgi:hypothetical protein